tara:strand:+ start:372 stop:479 length:108 start_codon:yes stop_codon:yes gene_type:complete
MEEERGGPLEVDIRFLHGVCHLRDLKLEQINELTI